MITYKKKFFAIKYIYIFNIYVLNIYIYVAHTHIQKFQCGQTLESVTAADRKLSQESNELERGNI